MRLVAAVTLVSLSFASAAMAQLAPGAVVRAGAPFPVVADFDGDGLDDLVQERNVVLNDGGSFTEVRDLGFSADERVVGALDVNGDHILELLTVTTAAVAPPSLGGGSTGQEPVYRMYLGNASRHYTKGVEISTGARPYIADVDADGKDDLVILAPISQNHFNIATEVTVLRSRGDGTFDRLAPFRFPAADPQMATDDHILSGDLNHDGLTDLVMRCPNDLVVLLGLGGGKFAVQTRYMPLNSRFGAWSTRLGDVDADSNDDVIIVGLRSIRVLFGDGRGNFPRTTTASIAKVHDISGLPAGLAELLHVDDMNQPRNLAVGHFTRDDRAQIAAGTVEGDLVVFSYERGALREVSRQLTEFWGLDIRTGSFRRGAGTGLYVVGALIWGDIYPRPRVFYGAPSAATREAEPALGRRRASGPGSTNTSLSVQLTGPCIGSATERWTFAREGVFGLAQQGDTTVEAVFDGADIDYRLSTPYAMERVQGVLTESGGSYSGTAQVLTSCGWNTMTVTAKLD